MTTCDFLLIGCEGCGKTTLLKQLSNMCKSLPLLESSHLSTLPTNGVELETITYKKHKYVVREIGGNFLPVWSKYYESSLMVIFMLDMANFAQISIAWVEFLNLLCHKSLYKKSFLLLLNKVDQPYAMARHSLQHVIHLDAALREAYARFGQAIWVEEVSAAKGNGLDKVLTWMADTKKSLAHAPAAPSAPPLNTTSPQPRAFPIIRDASPNLSSTSNNSNTNSTNINLDHNNTKNINHINLNNVNETNTSSNVHNTNMNNINVQNNNPGDSKNIININNVNSVETTNDSTITNTNANNININNNAGNNVNVININNENIVTNQDNKLNPDNETKLSLQPKQKVKR